MLAETTEKAAGLAAWLPAIGAAVASAIGVLAAAFIVARAGRHERIARESRRKRLQVYEEILKIVRQRGGAVRTTELGIEVALYASDEVVVAWTEILDLLIDRRGGTRDEQIRAWSKILAAMRKDAGRPSTRMKEREIAAALGLQDYRSVDAMIAKYGAPPPAPVPEENGED